MFLFITKEIIVFNIIECIVKKSYLFNKNYQKGPNPNVIFVLYLLLLT